MNTIFDLQSIDEKIDVSEFNYQTNLTNELDKINFDFNQEIINEIVLWKVNRYAKLNSSTLLLLNEIKKNSDTLNLELTKNILKELLETKGIRIAMASTILRFKNPKIYQIIDQRVYRYISKTGEELNEGTKIDIQIDKYMDYLIRLREVCEEYRIDFHESDRILYLMDKKYNKGSSLKESKKRQ